VLLDDRDERPGVKFGDAELLGVPSIVIVGKGVQDGLVELWDRHSGERAQLALDGAAEAVLGAISGR